MQTPTPDAASGHPAAPSFPESSPHEPQVRPWELELLISGAVVFSLLQLPGWVDGQYYRTRVHADGGTFLGAMMLYVYIKVALYTLIIFFLTHLAARGYWVGLIGLESVYPRGINWDNTTYGPVSTELYRRWMGRIQSQIDAADRFCSVLFPLAFSLVSLCLYSLLVMGLLAGVAYLASKGMGVPAAFAPVFLGVGALLAVLPAMLLLLDRRYGPAAKPDGPAHRGLRGLAAAVYYLSAMPAVGVMFITLYSNARRGMRRPMLMAGVGLLFAYVFAHDVMIGYGLLRVGGSPFYPDEAGEMAVTGAFYADQRVPGEVRERAPFIQSEVIEGPYVRLFIPYVPMLHGESLPEQCPGVRPVNEGGVRIGRAVPVEPGRTGALLACWTRLQPVALNGKPIAPAFRFATDPETGIRGIVAHIPVQGLPAGQNLLTVARAPRTAESRRRRPEKPEPSYIWFWL
ncbi:hypothetical protein [Longimicrobium terrae]|uniref:Uncharacterized protein n=1 Tax=Longimicrobium terrae TaxID=1639882 RepID=A0A841H587_9BACT|nr:hypothetical protein [Longimicrobium terrae]MBB4638899.1 hypothetical protein [Longimicrobium terrae]MBB6073138.1 hypothetical protein [Longimicrobium terrae]NNC30175.1 hypothetical protein [Longimicrobium terrae]